MISHQVSRLLINTRTGKRASNLVPLAFSYHSLSDSDSDGARSESSRQRARYLEVTRGSCVRLYNEVSQSGWKIGKDPMTFLIN